MRLKRFFDDRIFIRQHKTTATLENILKDNRFDRYQTWMIGNSIRTDFLPALRTGINAVYIPAVNEWAYNIVEIDAKPKGAFLTLNSLQDIRGAVQQFAAQSS
jgi:putative hydrolase of the HAD superfamily